MHEHLAIVAIFVFVYSLIAGLVERSVLSGPIIFVLTGVALGPLGLGIFPADESRVMVRNFADLTLALFLFIDAANADLRTLRTRFHIPARMLIIGLPGAIVLGGVLALFIFDVLSLYEAMIVGVMLAATDAALGKPVITNKDVPERLREGLNAESGLNDGLCVPILLALIALELASEETIGSGEIARLFASELGLGVLVGVTTATSGAFAFALAVKRGWANPVWEQMTTVALAIACFAIAQSVHASGYIAAFSGGLMFGYLAHNHTHALVHAAEGIAEVLALLTWFLFGYAVLAQVFGMMSWTVILYAILSLTIVRMLPIYISMTGSGETPQTKLFLGWFGPRGLASIVFAIIVIDHDLPNAELMGLIVICTVVFSLFAHGVTGTHLSKWIARQERRRS